MCETQNSINLRTLTRLDPSIMKIEDSATQVAVYKYSGKVGGWEKMEIEGSLFVVSRKSQPVYCLQVINRLNKTNMSEAISKKMELKCDAPYLLYKNEKSTIYCIWFYDKSECGRLGQVIHGLRSCLDSDSINGKLVQLGLKSGAPEEEGKRIFHILRKGSTESGHLLNGNGAVNLNGKSSKASDVTLSKKEKPFNKTSPPFPNSLKSLEKGDGVRFTFCYNWGKEEEGIWDGCLLDGNVYFRVPSDIQMDSSKEAFITLLECAEEEIACSNVIVSFNKNRSNKNLLMRMFMFFGFSLLQPNHPLSIAAGGDSTDFLFMAYNIS